MGVEEAEEVVLSAGAVGVKPKDGVDDLNVGEMEGEEVTGLGDHLNVSLVWKASSAFCVIMGAVGDSGFSPHDPRKSYQAISYIIPFLIP